MYWSRPRNRGIGGKMLKKIIPLLFLLTSLEAFACWRAKGSFAVDGETWKIDHKFDHGKEYIFPMGSFILKMTVKPGKTNQDLVFVVQEKKGTSLVLVTKGVEENIEVNKSRDIYAKGEEGQPNSIITIKLTKI